MKVGDTKSLMKAVLVFCIAGGIWLAVDFGSYYLGRYGFSVAHKEDDLWSRFLDAAKTSAIPGIAAATAVYLGAKRKGSVSESHEAT